jgi:hypothetical protein
VNETHPPEVVSTLVPRAVEVLGRISAALDDLPSHRPVAAKIIAEADDHRSDAKSLGRTLSYDPALVAKVLRLANSAYFGLSGTVSAPAFAVTVVGFSTVRSLAVSAMAGLDDVPPALEGFWDRSVLTAVAAAEFAPRLRAKAPDAFSVGLLARLGQALLVRCDPEEYPVLVAGAADRWRRRTAATAPPTPGCRPRRSRPGRSRTSSPRRWRRWTAPAGRPRWRRRCGWDSNSPNASWTRPGPPVRPSS